MPKKKHQNCLLFNTVSFSGDIDREIAEVNKQAHLFGKGSSFILTLFALIFLTNLAVAVWFHSFGQLFWGIALLSLLLLAAGYKGLKPLSGPTSTRRYSMDGKPISWSRRRWKGS